MKNIYNLIAGIAILLAAVTGYFYNNNRYYDVSEGSIEVTEYEYQKHSEHIRQRDFRVDRRFNFGIAFAAGFSALGLGLVLISIKNRNKKPAL